MSTVIICALLILLAVFTIRSYMRKLAQGCYMIVDLKEASAELYMKEAYDDEQIRTMFKKIGYQAEQIETI